MSAAFAVIKQIRTLAVSLFEKRFSTGIETAKRNSFGDRRSESHFPNVLFCVHVSIYFTCMNLLYVYYFTVHELIYFACVILFYF